MRLFLRFLKCEIFKIFHSGSFYIVTGLLILAVIVDGLMGWRTYDMNLQASLRDFTLRSDGTFDSFPWLQIYTLYNSWIGGRGNEAIPQAFLYTIPIFAVIPYTSSYLSEEKRGYVRTMTSLLGKPAYYIGKHISVFFSGFVTVAIPLLVSFAFTACLIPAYTPDVTCALYYQISGVSLFRELYYTHPLLTAFLNMFLLSVFGGAWATVSYVTSFFVKNKFAALFAPYLVLLLIIASLDRIFTYRVMAYDSYLETSIFNYLGLTSNTKNQNLYVLLGEICALIFVPFFITLVKGRKADVY